MAAPRKNKFAQKWDEPEVIAMLRKIETEALKPTCTYLGTALVKVKLYKSVWHYWKKTFGKKQEVFELMERIEQIFEERLYSGALKGKYNATIAKLGLTNHHGYTDKTQTDVTTAGKPISAPQTLDLSKATDEELDALEAITTKLGGAAAGKGKA